MLAAVEAWVKRDHKAEWKTWLVLARQDRQARGTIDGVKTPCGSRTGLSNKSPSLSITWDSTKLHITGEEMAEELARTKPRIALGAGIGGGRGSGACRPGTTAYPVTAWQMQPGEDKIVADRLHERAFAQASAERCRDARAGGESQRRWDVDVEFFSSRSQHTLYIEQDGNWIQGSHKGDFSVRDMVGIIEGDKVTLRSVERRRATPSPYIFSGTLADGAFSGPIHLGGYPTAKFTAKRHTYRRRAPGSWFRRTAHRHLVSTGFDRGCDAEAAGGGQKRSLTPDCI